MKMPILLRKELLLVGILAVGLFFTVGIASTQENPPFEVSLDIGTQWWHDYRWNIIKEVRPASADAAVGETVYFDYEITLDQVFDSETFRIGGSMLVYNPAPTSRSYTISTVIGGSLNAETRCFDHFGAESFTLYGETTGECSFLVYLDGLEFAGQEVVVTVTDEAGVTSTASDVVEWPGEPTVFDAFPDIVTVVDDAEDPFFDSSWEGAMLGMSFLNQQSYTCPADLSLYVNGQYSVTINNTASISGPGEIDGAVDSASVTVNCFTSAVEQCTYSHGYWRNHSAAGPAPYDDAWRNIGSGEAQTIFFRSGQTYFDVLGTPPAGNPYYQLAHAYIAAKLNILNGVSPSQEVIEAIGFAEEIFFTYAPTDALPNHIPDLMRDFGTVLDNFNSGVTGPGACSE